MKFLKQWWNVYGIRYAAITMVCLVLFLVLLATPVFASSWSYYFPITITDTSGVARTNVPILTNVQGTNLSNAGYMTSGGMDTDIQSGTTSLSYMMGTTQIPVVIPNLGSYSSSTVNLYTGYSPNQTSFPIITGNNGQISTVNSTSLNIGTSGNYSEQVYFNPASTGYLFNSSALTVQGNGSGNVTASIPIIYGGSFPSAGTANVYSFQITTTNASGITSKRKFAITVNP